jgi:hypothetical protein
MATQPDLTGTTLHREINALGGVPTTDYGRGHNDAIGEVLAILERRGFTEAADGDIAHLRLIADLAFELVMQPGGLRNNGRQLVVVEKRDRSDAHYRLCGALEGYVPSLSASDELEAAA